MRRWRLATVGLVGVVMLVGLAGCGSPAPLGSADTINATVCNPLRAASTYTLGDEALTNTSDGDLTIQSVALEDPVNARLIGARLLFVGTPRGGTLIGSWPEYPPVIAPTLKGIPSFATSVSALDAHVPPSRHGRVANLLVGVRILHPGQPVSVHRLVVHYDGIGAVWTWHGTITYRLQEHC